MRALLDVNVLLALLDTKHVHYVQAHRWLNANLGSGWASCPLTENGHLRIITGPSYPNRKTPGEAIARLDESKRNGHHAFWPDDVSITDATVFNRDRLRGHQQITDVYLLALAVAHGGRLVTFDANIRREVVPGSGPEHLVVL